MIAPKTVKPFARDEAEAYELIIPTDTALAYLQEKGIN